MGPRLIKDMLAQAKQEIEMCEFALSANETLRLAYHVERALKQIKEIDIAVFSMGRVSGVPYAVTEEDWK